MRLIEKVWFKQHSAQWLLVPLLFPLTIVFWLITLVRRTFFKCGVLSSFDISVPVIVVGNIGVGGNGKTPVVIFLIELCQKLGLTVGVVSRGYGGNAPHYPYLLHNETTAIEAGDEPLLIYNRCNTPVAVGPDRVAAANLLVDQGCTIIIADDGLQHYRLKRNIEMIVVDEKRKFGNGLLLPAGPLREGKWRLSTVNYVIRNLPEKLNSEDSFINEVNNNVLDMVLCPEFVCNVQTGEKISLQVFIKAYKKVNAMAGIGDPERFFKTLRIQKFELNQTKAFVDHHHFQTTDFEDFSADYPLFMTEKDAVKCKVFAKHYWWYVPVSAEFDEKKVNDLMEKIQLLTSSS